ncbi:hypothetical protein Tco_1144740 [Tanacetum coccineum]
MLKVGYDNGNEIDMYVEHFRYDIMELAELERNKEQNHNSIESSDDEYYGSDDCEEIENVDFQTEGESVVIKNISTHDPFLNKLCSARIMFRGTAEHHETETPLVDPDENQIDYVNKREVLVYCGRNVEDGRRAGKKGNKDRVMKNKVRSGVQIGVKKKVVRKKVVKKKVIKKKLVSDFGEGTSQSPKWTKKQVRESKQVACPFRMNYKLGSLVSYRWIALQFFKKIIKDPFMSLRKMGDDIRQKFMIDVSLGQCRRAKQLALFDHEGGLIEHYGKLYQYRQALLDSNPGSTCRLDVDESANGSATFRRIYICSKGVKDGWLVGCRKVMSTLAQFESKIISQTNGAQSSRVPTPLPDDPYVAVRQAYLVDTDTESDPEEAPSEIEKCQPLVSRATLTDEEFEVSEPSDTRITSSHSSASSDSTAPLSPDHPLAQTSPTPTPTRVSFHRRTARMAVCTQPTLSPGMSARIAEASALSPSSFRKMYRSSYETSSSSPPALPIRKRYQGTLELVEDTKDESSDSGTEREGSEGEGHSLEDKGHGSEDEGPSSEDEGPCTKEDEEEEATLEGQQQTVPVMDTAAGEPLRLSYGTLRRRELVVGEGEMPNTFEVGQRSRSVPEHEGAERVSAFRQSTLITWVNLEDGRVYIDIPTYVPPVAPIQTPPSLEWPSEVRAQLELHGSILYDHTHRLDALPPTLFEGYHRDLRELYTRSGAVRDEIFSQRYRFRSLEREQERATVTFSAIWRENHDLRMQIAEDRRERLELTDRVARMERRQESRRG